MHLSSPIDLEKNKWYYNRRENNIFKVLRNNTTVIDESVSGFVIIQEMNSTPLRRSSESIAELIDIGEIKLIDQQDKVSVINDTKNTLVEEAETK